MECARDSSVNHEHQVQAIKFDDNIVPAKREGNLEFQEEDNGFNDKGGRWRAKGDEILKREDAIVVPDA
ncbi:uncharacterized protein A4U43_C01F21430 [Asparagus officinalis]|uniref:Uncharacterized protein n=1 Tax=Asparagus officinalis TaxID=4686 RepID=A0A5P1FUR5_ASPOF|nr:uncharacterized protein A4U43_C01F21430 [Asparagus officinalis]